MSLQDPSVPFDLPAEGTGLLVRGPPMTGKYDLVLRVLASADRGILISTGTAADTVLKDFESYGDEERLGIVDAATRRQRADATDTERVRHVPSPENLTALGVKFTDLAESFAGEEEYTVVALHSLSELLVYWETQRVYRFLRVLIGQAREFGWATVAVLDDAAVDQQAVHTLTEPFDAVVDTREGDEGHELRFRQRHDAEAAWTSF